MGSLQGGISYGAGRINVGGSEVEAGVRFHVGVDTPIASLAWWRSVTGAGVAPEIVRIWDWATHVELARLTSVPDDGAVGWQTGPLPETLTLTAGTVYAASGAFPGSGGQPSGGGPVTPDSPFTFEANFRCYLIGSLGFPTNADAGSYIGIDVIAGTSTGGGGGGTGASAADVGAEIAKWESTDAEVQTHQADGIPWYLKTLADAWNSGLGSGATGYFSLMKTTLNAVKERTDRLPDSIEVLTNAILTSLTTNIDLVQANLALIQAGVDAITGGSGGTAGGPIGALSARSAFPTELWTLVDEIDFTWQTSWDVGADLYVLTVADIPPWVDTADVDGAIWRPRLGWWAPRNGDFFGRRMFVDWEKSHLEDQGRRMAGIVIRTQYGCTCHLQAWRVA